MRKMKDSGIEWIGEIPEDWKLSRIKFLSRVLRGASPRPIDNPVYFDPKGKFSWVRISDVTTSNHYLYNAGEKLSELGASKSVKIEPNNLFISICATVGKPCISKINCCIHDGFVYFPNLEKTFTEYLYWIFFSGTCYQGLGNWGTQLNLNTNIIGNIHIAYPSENKRKIITNYINICCDRIDTLIKKEQQVIEKLKAYRQSVISEAVTRGLDPDAPMKDSGIPWIGKIPSHWNIAKLKYLANIYGGATPSKDFSDYWNNGNIPWISAKDLKTNKIYTSSDYITHEGFESCSLSLIEANSLIICTRSGILKHTLPAVINKIPVTINQDLKSLTFNKNIIHTQFIQYLFLGRNSQLLILLRNSGATVESIDIDLLKNIFICIPPLEEQQQISKYLDEICMAFDSIITKKQSLIAKLTEYKKSIIYEYVTGKKEVPAS